MTCKLKAVLWDMDGVLADTRELHFLTWKDALHEIGYELTYEQFTATFGMNNRRILETLLGQPPTPELVAEMTDKKEGQYRRLLSGNVSLLPGVQYWLSWLHDHHIPQAVASSAPQANIDAFVDELQLRPYFSALVSGYDMAGKPDPGIFLQAASHLQVAPKYCLVIEDSIAGVEAAWQGGMCCLAITTTNPRTALTRATQVIDSLELIPPEEWFPEYIECENPGG